MQVLLYIDMLMHTFRYYLKYFPIREGYSSQNTNNRHSKKVNISKVSSRLTTSSENEYLQSYN